MSYIGSESFLKLINKHNVNEKPVDSANKGVVVGVGFWLRGNVTALLMLGGTKPRSAKPRTSSSNLNWNCTECHYGNIHRADNYLQSLFVALVSLALFSQTQRRFDCAPLPSSADLWQSPYKLGGDVEGDVTSQSNIHWLLEFCTQNEKPSKGNLDRVSNIFEKVAHVKIVLLLTVTSNLNVYDNIFFPCALYSDAFLHAALLFLSTQRSLIRRQHFVKYSNITTSTKWTTINSDRAYRSLTMAPQHFCTFEQDLKAAVIIQNMRSKLEFARQR